MMADLETFIFKEVSFKKVDNKAIVPDRQNNNSKTSGINQQSQQNQPTSQSSQPTSQTANTQTSNIAQ